MLVCMILDRAGPRIRTKMHLLLSSPLHHDLSVSLPQTWCSSQTELFWVLNLGFLLFFFVLFFFFLLLSLVNNPVPPIFSTKITSCMNSFLPNKKEKKKRERRKNKLLPPWFPPLYYYLSQWTAVKCFIF